MRTRDTPRTAPAPRTPARATSPGSSPPQGGSRRPGWALALLCAAQFMVVLDLSIVNVALPAIRTDLGFATQGGLQYVISLYALTFGGSLILAGRAADLLGRRRLFLAGLGVFGAASLGCGLATTPAALLASRAVQGLGSALVSAAALALVITLFAEGPERNRALGAWGAVGGAAGASGLILGGALTGLLGWPWVFYLNVPIVVGAILATPRLLRTGIGQADTHRLDLPGALTLTSGLGLLVFGLSRAEQAGFTAGSTLGLLATAVGLLVGFVAIEHRVPHPLVPVRLFRIPGIPVANLAGVLLTSIVASNLFFTTLYVQQVLQFSPLETGLAFLPNSALVLVGSAVATRLVTRLGSGPILVAGFGVLGIASVLLSTVSPGAAYTTHVLPGFALTGLGLGLAFVSVTIAATRGVEERDSGLASGVVNTAQQIGFAIGIAAVVAAAHALTAIDGTSGIAAQIASYSSGYLVDAAIAAVGIGVALLLVRTNHGNRR